MLCSSVEDVDITATLLEIFPLGSPLLSLRPYRPFHHPNSIEPLQGIGRTCYLVVAPHTAQQNISL